MRSKRKNRTQARVRLDHLRRAAIFAGGSESVDDPAEIAKYLKANSVDTVMGR